MDRRTHAATLRAELRRVRPSSAQHRPAPPRPDQHSTSPPVAPQPPTPELASARGALTEAVRAAHDEAAGLVMTLPGYRAALLASVAACCASHAALLS
jgi:type IV secretory pathway VirB10-like protein